MVALSILKMLLMIILLSYDSARACTSGHGGRSTTVTTCLSRCGIEIVDRDAFTTRKCAASISTGRCILFSDGNVCLRVIHGNYNRPVGGNRAYAILYHFDRCGLLNSSLRLSGSGLCCSSVPRIFAIIGASKAFSNSFSRDGDLVCLTCDDTSIPSN